MSNRRARPYHHGDLKTALVDEAMELIAERGIRQFSLAELSRRVGVSVAAPYRHFADRDALLAGVAVRALQALESALAAQSSETSTPEETLAAMCAAYVHFAAEQPDLFGLIFGLGLDKKHRHPELREAYEKVEGLLESCVAELCPHDKDAAERLADAIEATAHGYATLLTDRAGPPEPVAIDLAAEGAGRTARALIKGRDALG